MEIIKPAYHPTESRQPSVPPMPPKPKNHNRKAMWRRYADGTSKLINEEGSVIANISSNEKVSGYSVEFYQPLVINAMPLIDADDLDDAEVKALDWIKAQCRRQIVLYTQLLSRLNTI